MAGRFKKPTRVKVIHWFVAALALSCGSAAASPALAAADVTPAEAAILESQVRDALAALLPPTLPAPDRPVHITVAGDHFDVTAPITAEALDGTGMARITAVARPAKDGSWAVDDIRITSPLRFTYAMPGLAEGDSARRAVSTIAIEGQDGRIAWDPSDTTPSTWTLSATGTTVHTEAGLVSQESKLGPSRSVTTLRPAGPDRADVLVEGALQDYSIDSLVSDAPVHIGMQRISVTSALNGMSRSKAMTLIQALTGIAGRYGSAPPGAQHGTTAPQIPPAVVHTILDALQDFATEYTLDETIDGFATQLQGQAIGIGRLKVGLSARSDNGSLQAGMDLGVDGLVIPDLPIGEMASLVPRRFALRPVLSGLRVSVLKRMANDTADGRKPAPEDIQELFSHGVIQFALESMMVDIAGTVFSGQARMTASGPSGDNVHGTAQITAEHFDDLMQKLAAMPELTQIMPALVFAKGIGRSSNNQLVWDLSYRNGKLLVNNMDLTAMMGGSTPDRGGTDGRPKMAQPRPPTQKQPPNRAK